MSLTGRKDDPQTDRAMGVRRTCLLSSGDRTGSFPPLMPPFSTAATVCGTGLSFPKFVSTLWCAAGRQFWHRKSEDCRSVL